jgi:hypothetical protein
MTLFRALARDPDCEVTSEGKNIEKNQIYSKKQNETIEPEKHNRTPPCEPARL